MWEPPWKSLVESLRRDGFQSLYLDRLADRLGGRIPGRKSLEEEILEEMSQALTRAAAKIDFALLNLELAEREIEQAKSEAERAEKIRVYNERRDEAWKARWEFVVHREALGFTRHEQIERDYPIPAKKRG